MLYGDSNLQTSLRNDVSLDEPESRPGNIHPHLTSEGVDPSQNGDLEQSQQICSNNDSFIQLSCVSHVNPRNTQPPLQVTDLNASLALTETPTYSFDQI